MPAHAQVSQGKVLQLPQRWVNPLPIDSATGKVSYRAVVQAPGLSEAELYKRAKQWFAEAPSTTKTPLLTDDAAAGRLVGQTGELVRQNVFGANVQIPLWRTITIEVKPGRFRYQITDFAFDSGKGLGAVTPIENYLTPQHPDLRCQRLPPARAAIHHRSHSAQRPPADQRPPPARKRQKPGR
ncbi:MAG: DUF4468 domain-containing protein [Hymenobacter sp.]